MLNFQQYTIQASILDAWHARMWRCAGRQEADRLVERARAKLASGSRLVRGDARVIRSPGGGDRGSRT